MKKETRTNKNDVQNNETHDIELESVNDIFDRIEGLSYEARRHIIAYLKAKMVKSKKD